MYPSEGICFEIGKRERYMPKSFLLQYIHFHTLQKKIMFFMILNKDYYPIILLEIPLASIAICHSKNSLNTLIKFSNGCQCYILAQASYIHIFQYTLLTLYHAFTFIYLIVNVG